MYCTSYACRVTDNHHCLKLAPEHLEQYAAALPGDDAEAAAVHVEQRGQLMVQTHTETLAHNHLGGTKLGEQYFEEFLELFLSVSHLPGGAE